MSEKKIISGYIFSDNFTGELVSAKDINFGTAPPERYIKIIRHPQESLYLEKWTVKDSDNLFVDVSCEASKYWDKEYGASFYRRAVENQHNIKLGRMVNWYVPASVFDKWVSDYNLTPVQDLRCVGDIAEIEVAMENKVFCAIEEKLHDISKCKICKYYEEECGCVYWEQSGDAEMYRSREEIEELKRKTSDSWGQC